MSFYDDASLVVIPSAQKTSKLYAVKPTDGSGDLAFTRTGDTATRVNSAGIIEKVRTNLVTRSQEFDNAAWTKDRTTVTANATTAPDGTATADKVVDTLQGNNAYRIYNGVTLSAISYSASFYVKAAEYSWVYIRIGNSLRVWFNVSTGVVGTNDFGITGTIQSAGNGWYRCTAIIATATAGGGFSLLGLTNANGVETYTPSTGGQGVFVWGAQLETTDFGATPYIPTTTAAVSVGPVANVTRLDYTGSTCPRLFLEPQRTNLLQFSEHFNNAYWSLSGATITSNTTVAPDGTQSADTLTGVSGNFRVFRVVSGLSNIDYSFSVFVKQGTSNTVKLDFVNVSDGPVFNFTTKTFTTVSGFTTRFEQYANGWFRLFATRVSNTTSAGLGINVAGAGQTVFIWGAQMEAGSYGTSYIPTLAASATRGADACSKTGISSLIGQTEGTLFAQVPLEYLNFATYRGIISVSDGTFNNGVFIFVDNDNGNSNQFAAYVRNNGGNEARIIGSNLTTANIGSTYKIAIAYKANDFVFFINGVQIGSDTSGSIAGTLSRLDLGSIGVTGLSTVDRQSVRQSLVFKTRLTNAQLAELTTL